MLEYVALEEIKKVNKTAYKKLVEMFEQELSERNIRRKDLYEDEFELLLQYRYEGMISCENDPQKPNFSKAFILESRIPSEPLFWNGVEWVAED